MHVMLKKSDAAGVSYRLDADNNIVGVNFPGSDGYAEDIEARRAIGTNLLWHVSGLSTMAYVKAILDGARRGKQIRMPYRCDAPGRRRRWVMEASLISGDGLLLTHSLIEDRALTSRLQFRTSDSFVQAIPRCSICNHVFWGTGWEDLEENEESHVKGVLRDGGIMDVVYEICPSCRAHSQIDWMVG